MAHFIFYADFFIKDFYVAFTARVQFFQAASKEYKTSRWEAACQGCLVKPPRPKTTSEKKHVICHFAMTSVKHARELAFSLSDENVFSLSADDKARVPLGFLV